MGKTWRKRDKWYDDEYSSESKRKTKKNKFRRIDKEQRIYDELENSDTNTKTYK